MTIQLPVSSNKRNSGLKEVYFLDKTRLYIGSVTAKSSVHYLAIGKKLLLEMGASRIKTKFFFVICWWM